MSLGSDIDTAAAELGTSIGAPTFAEHLQQLVESALELAQADNEDVPPFRIRSYEEGGYLTHDSGFVVSFGHAGEFEFQVTVKAA